MIAPNDPNANEEWGEKMMSALAGGYQPGQCFSEQMGFASGEAVSEIFVRYRHGATDAAHITAHGVPALRKRAGNRNFYEVKLSGVIKHGRRPGTYEPFDVRFRVDGNCNDFSVVRSPLSPITVIEPHTAAF